MTLEAEVENDTEELSPVPGHYQTFHTSGPPISPFYPAP